MLTSLWTQLQLDTRPFQSGLTGAQKQAGDFAKRVASTMRSTFISAINPVAWLRSIVTATAAAQQTLAGMDQKRVEMQAGSVPLEDFQRLASIADQFNLSLERMVELWKDNSREAAVFRNVLVGEGKSGGATFTNALGGAESLIKLMGAELTDRQHFPGNFLGFSPASILLRFWGRLLAPLADDNSGGLGASLQRLMDAQARRKARDEVAGNAPLPFGGFADFWSRMALQAYRGRADVLSDAIGRFSGGRGTLSTVSGYSGLVAASNAQLQTSLLQLIEQHTRVVAEVQRMEARSP